MANQVHVVVMLMVWVLEWAAMACMGLLMPHPMLRMGWSGWAPMRFVMCSWRWVVLQREWLGIEDEKWKLWFQPHW